MVTPEVSASSHKKTKRKLENLEDPPSFTIDAPVKKKKKKRASEEEEFNPHPADEPTLSPEKKKKKKKLESLEDPLVLVDINTPEKKKKTGASEEEEFNLHPADETTLSPEKKKKKKKKLKSLEDPPVPVDINTPERKKKTGASEEEEFNLHPADETTLSPEKKKKKKKKKLESLEDPPVLVDINTPERKKKTGASEEEEFNLHPADETTLSPEKKKKKKKKLKSLEDLPVPVDINTPEKKKKTGASEEEEFNLHPADETMLSPEKKKKKKKKKLESLEDPPVLVDINTPERKKKTGASEEEEFNLHPADETTLSPEKKKKKKKKKLESLEDPPVPVDINTPERKKKTGASEEEEFNPHPADETTLSPEKKKKKKITEKCVIEVTSQREKKKKQKSVTVATLSPNHEEAVVSTETAVTSTTEEQNDGGKKEKKNKKPEKSSSEDELKSKFGMLDLQLIEEMKAFIPGTKKWSAESTRQLLQYDLPRFRKFKQQGIRLRRGRFSKEENQKILANISDFLALTGIKSAIDLFPQLSREKNAEIKKLKVRYHFLERIAEGIPRSCHQVYIRATKLLDDLNQVGRFSEEEVESLKKLHRLHGNSWSMISKKMARSSYSLQKRFSTLDSNHGRWNKEEELRIKQAAREYFETLIQQGPPGSGLSRDQLCNNLPWKQISQKVQTRSWIQCRLKWFSILKFRLSSNGGTFNRGAGGCQAKICLINTLFNMSVEDPADIDWEEVAHAIGKATPVCTQKAFNRLKCQKVPNWNRLSYDEIICFLKFHVVPELQNRLKSHKKREERQEQYGEDRYDLADIFEDDVMDSSCPEDQSDPRCYRY